MSRLALYAIKVAEAPAAMQALGALQITGGVRARPAPHRPSRIAPRLWGGMAERSSSRKALLAARPGVLRRPLRSALMPCTEAAVSQPVRPGCPHARPKAAPRAENSPRRLCDFARSASSHGVRVQLTNSLLFPRGSTRHCRICTNQLRARSTGKPRRGGIAPARARGPASRALR